MEDLRELQFSGRKAEYVIGVAEKVSLGAIFVQELKHLYNQEIHDILIKLHQESDLGRYKIFSCFRRLGRPNLFPMANIGFSNALKKRFNLAQKPSKAVVFKRFWEPYLSYVSLYLWRSLESGV